MHSEMWALRYLFYRLYSWQVECWNDENVSVNALVLVVVLFFMNFVTLVGVGESLFGIPILTGFPKRVFHIGALVLGGLMAVPLYFYLLHKKKWKRIVREFESESAEQRHTRGIAVALYAVFSVVFLFAGAMLHRKMVSR